MVTTILSLCPPSKEDGSEAERNVSSFKVTSSFKKKKKRRRILSDSEEELDASSRFVYYFKLYIMSKCKDGDYAIGLSKPK